MAKLVTIQDFEVGRCALAIAPHREDYLQDIIDSCEVDVLHSLMGESMFNAFYQDITMLLPVTPKYLDLYNPMIYKAYNYAGMKKMLIKKIFVEYNKSVFSIATINGIAKQDTSVSQQSGQTELAIIYNSFIYDYQFVQSYIKLNIEDYPEFDHTSKCKRKVSFI